MIISKITRQKQLNDRYNIFTIKNGKEEYAFSVDEGILIKYQLQKGMEIDSFLLSEIQFNDDIRKGYNQAVNYLAKVKRTEMEVEKFLKTKIEGEFIVGEVLTKLKEMKFIDDEDYAYSYVRTQKNTTDKGPEVIKREMKEKGISHQLIQTSIQKISYEEQLASAKKIAAKLVGSNKKESKRMLGQKIEQTLRRKGHSSSIIQEIKIELAEVNETMEESEALRIQGEKAKRKYSKYEGFEYKQKMKQYLYRKGFTVELIDQYFEEIVE
ncbi:recombination regulator RecX [Niallia sp. NCCP-28]|uniref:recombination regulator RecX n=1 Tax=Niallia sp. NCCP-28 TaxID=2934712 RepID=UPI0020801F62|nr:recombination regulator RecX [Niallia sp. NCCP-28]GKU85241.1 regulatory protein RecX [Niallia sp. NCCP-28]